MSMRLILMIGLIYTVIAGWLGASAAKHKWHTYSSPAYGFKIDVPSDMTYFPGSPVQPPQKSTLPICDTTTVACFQYTGGKFNHTVVQAMGVSVNVLRDKRTEAECNNIRFNVTKSIMIHGRPFHYAETGSVAAGSSKGGTLYRTFYQGVCFEVTLTTAYSDIEPARYGKYGIKPLNQRALHAMQKEMKKMLRSMTFVGPVNDGARWNVYNDWGCGGLFEYPAGVRVKNLVPYTMAAFHSHGVTCEQEFSYGGRVYQVAAKASLHGRRGIHEWLVSQGFPGLTRINTVTRGEGFTQYSGRNFTCFFTDNVIYIFTVSGANHKPMPISGDRVFAHLVDTFKLN